MSELQQMKVPEPVLRLCAPMSAGPILFGYRHAENQPENYQLLTGDAAQLQRASCSEVTLMREIPRDEWESCGFYIDEWEGQKVVAQKFNKTAKLLTDKKQAETPAVQAEELTIQEMQEKMQLLEHQNQRLIAMVEKSNDFIAQQAEQQARADEVKELEILAEQSEAEEAKAAAPAKPARKAPAKRRTSPTKPKATAKA